MILQELILRLGAAILPNLALGIAGLLARAFDRTGLILGVIIGSVVTYAFGWGGFLALACFVVLGSAATRLGLSRKIARGISEPARGRRTWKNAAANLVVPAFAALAALASPAAVLKMFFAASVATAAFDTVASEMGKAYGGVTVTLQDLKRREPGVPGGISLVGTVSGAVAALAIAIITLAYGLVSPGLAGYVVLSALLAAASESLLKSAVGITSTHVANVINTVLGGLFGALFFTGAGGV